MPDLYTRMSSTTKASTLGVVLVLLGTALIWQDIGITARVVIIISFLFLTAPVAAHVIGRAAYFDKVPLWEKTQAYMVSNASKGVNINCLGREESGIVPMDSYDQLRKEIMEKLRGLKGAEGESILEVVEPREKVYDGISWIHFEGLPLSQGHCRYRGKLIGSDEQEDLAFRCRG